MMQRRAAEGQSIGRVPPNKEYENEYFSHHYFSVFSCAVCLIMDMITICLYILSLSTEASTDCAFVQCEQT